MTELEGGARGRFRSARQLSRDDWQHRCVVERDKVDPVNEYGAVPPGPVAVWGWGWTPLIGMAAARNTAAKTAIATFEPV